MYASAHVWWVHVCVVVIIVAGVHTTKCSSWPLSEEYKTFFVASHIILTLNLGRLLIGEESHGKDALTRGIPVLTDACAC